MFSWISSMVWNFFSFKGDFSFVKSQKSQAPKLGCRGAESPGWFDVLPKNCTTHDAWVGALSWWSCQSPVAHSCNLLNHPNSFVEEYSSLRQNLMQIRCSSSSVILNVTATQYTCSLNGVYHPHWLVQWSCHCSHKHIPVLSPWLPSYIGVVQTIVVILTMVGLFPGRPHIL